MLLRLFLDNTRPAIWILCFSKSEKVALSSLSRPYILADLLGNKGSWFVIGGFGFVLCVSVFLGSLLCFWKRIVSLHWNMESLDFQGEIVPIEPPNLEETQIRKGENEPVRSRQHFHSLTNTVDATVTVWLTSQKYLNLERTQYELSRISAEVPFSSRLI